MNPIRQAIFLLIGAWWWLASSVYAMSDIQRWQTTAGAEVWFVPAPELPMIDVRLVFDAGSARDGGRAGIANLTNTLIGMGDASKDEETFTNDMESLGVQFSTSALKDMAVVSLRSLTRPEILDSALTLSANALTQPSFSAKVLDRVKAQRLLEIKAKQQSPASIATEQFWQKLYENHPYSQPSEGSPASLSALTTADLTAFHRHYYTAKNASVAIVGAVSRAQAEQIAESLTSGLPVGNKAPALPAVLPVTAGYDRIDFPSTQSQVLLGQLGIDRQNPDYPALYLINHLWGGSGFASRLMEEVREKRGLVYGVSSSLLPMRAQGPWMVSLKTANANTNMALQVVQETTQAMLTGMTQQELEDHKSNILGGFALQIDSNKDMVGYLAMMAFYDLPVDWLQSFPKQIEGLTLEQVQKVAQAYLKPESWVGVLLGKQSEQNPINAMPVPLPKIEQTVHH